MGTVFLARHRQLQRLVAVKLLSDSLAGEKEARDRFLREARSMASLEHPNIARVYSFGEEEGQAYIEMEYVDGESLAARLRRAGRMSVEETLRVVLPVVDALNAAWSKGIVHRDVKPSNVLLTSSGEVRVVDFGLAKVAGRGDPVITGTGEMVGTPAYVSPEQATGETVDHRSDIYSLGVMLYEMLAGERPFQGKTPMAIVARQLHEPLPPLEKAVSDVPPELAGLVARMTEKDPRRRVSSYEELRVNLSSVRRASVLRPPMPQAKRHVYLAAAVLVVLLGVAAYFARRDVPAPVIRPTVQVDKLTSRGTVGSPVLSPDGRYVAYLSDETGRTTLWLRDVTERTEVPLVDPSMENTRTSTSSAAMASRSISPRSPWDETRAGSFVFL